MASDAFDAMTSDRPYRPDGLTVEAAIKDIVRCSGTQFDPEVVDALVRASAAGRLTVVRRPTLPRGMQVVERVPMHPPIRRPA
jgi:HD-GYP domain-containing protein (c-di-GMP phosphodiesterase class II)